MGEVRQFTQRKKWTKEEEEQLKRLARKYTKSDIARIMKRSPSSISNKRKELEIEPFIELTDKWNFNQISEAVGVSRGVVNRTWVKHGLKYTRKGCYRVVDEKDLLDFMKNHTELWDATKCDYYLFYQYPWFMEKLKKDKQEPYEKKQYYWTDYQKSQFEVLKKRGFSHREIAERIGKTKRAVDHMSIRYSKKKEVNNARPIQHQ